MSDPNWSQVIKVVYKEQNVNVNVPLGSQMVQIGSLSLSDANTSSQYANKKVPALTVRLPLKQEMEDVSVSLTPPTLQE